MNSSKNESIGRAEGRLDKVKDMLYGCIQCGTCTGSCPNEFAMDHTPRRLWRMVLTDSIDEVLRSKTFALCSACYFCTLRCPRGLPLTEAMSTLKQIAAREKLSTDKSGERFHKSFLQSVRRSGRVHEMAFMMLYFTAMKNPVLPLRFAPLGIKLMLKGKISLRPTVNRQRKLDAIFRQVDALEKTA